VGAGYKPLGFSSLNNGCKIIASSSLETVRLITIATTMVVTTTNLDSSVNDFHKSGKSHAP
jgi:hypothetical protein